MLTTPFRPAHADLDAIRRQIADIRAVADSSVLHAITEIEAAFAGALEHEKRRMIAHAVKPLRDREDAALRDVLAGLSQRARRELFDELLDPRILS